MEHLWATQLLSGVHSEYPSAWYLGIQIELWSEQAGQMQGLCASLSFPLGACKGATDLPFSILWGDSQFT